MSQTYICRLVGGKAAVGALEADRELAAQIGAALCIADMSRLRQEHNHLPESTSSAVQPQTSRDGVPPQEVLD